MAPNHQVELVRVILTLVPPVACCLWSDGDEKWRLFKLVGRCNFLFSFAGGLKDLVTDRDKLIIAVGAVTALAGGVYMTRSVFAVFYVYYSNSLHVLI